MGAQGQATSAISLRQRYLKTDPELHAISAGGGDDDSPSC
jgi:hypothetical protein